MSVPPDMADIWGMRPKLRHDVVFLEAPTGAYLRGADTAFLLKGRSAFRWLVTLGPYLTGGHTLEQICGSLDAGQRQTVATLVRALTSRGFAKDARDRAPVPEPVGRRFARQIEFIDHFADDPTSRFLRFHEARVALGGTGPTLLTAATALLRNGCARIEVHPEDDPADHRAALRAEAEELRADGVPVDVTISADALDPTGVDAVIYCADTTRLSHVLDLTRRCHAAGPLLVPVIWTDQRAVLGPTTSTGSGSRIAASSSP